MIRKTTWVLVAIFAVLLGSIWLIPWVQTQNPQPTPTVQATSRPLLQGSTVTQFAVTSAEGSKVVAEKAAGATTWSVTEPQGLVVDPTKIETAASYIQGARVQTELTTQPPATAVGLEKPTYTITAKMEDGTELVLNVGSATPTGSGYYAQTPGQSIFIISKGDIDPAIELLTAGATPTPLVSTTAAPSGTSVPEPGTTPTP